MKKTFIKLSALIFVISMASCKKDRTCTCTDTFKSSGSTVSTSSTSTSTLKEVSGKAAKGACASYEETYQSGSATITETHDCSLD